MAPGRGNKLLYIESALVLFVVLALIGLFTFIPFNLKLFNLKEAFKDFDLTDIYFSRIKSEDIRNPDIIIIDIDTLGRKSIGEIIRLSAAQNPTAIGLDVYFRELKDSLGDASLKKAFAAVGDRLVLSGFYDYGENKQWVESNSYFGTYSTGFNNLVGMHRNNGTVRYFRTIEEGRHAFALEVVKKRAPENVSRLLRKSEQTHLINYSGNFDQFIHISGHHILEGSVDLSQLENKIVLLGYAGNVREKYSLEDAHFTPLNDELGGRSMPDMYGVLIHANIISMILREDYVQKVGNVWNFIIASVIGFLHIVVFTYYFVKQHIWFHLVAKITQLVTSVLMMWVVVILFSKGIKFEPGLTLGIILLSVDVLYFYEGGAAFFYKRWGLKSYFIHEHSSEH